MLNFFLVVSAVVVGSCQGFLNRVYTKHDESELIKVIVDSQLENQKSKWFFENSLSSTYYATDGLTRLNREIPNSQQLCQTLQSHKTSNWEELHHLLMTRSRIKDCLKSVTEKTQSKLVSGLESSKLSHVYYAIDAIHALSKLGLFDRNMLDMNKLLTHLSTFQNSKDLLFAETPKSSSSSVYRSSLALLSTVKLLSMCEAEYLIVNANTISETLIKFSNGAKNLFGKYDSNGDFLSYANSLTATSFVVESLQLFLLEIENLGKLQKEESGESYYENLLSEFVDPFNDSKYVEKLCRYVLSYMGNTNVVTSRHILSLMKIVESSNEFSQSRPITIQFSNNVFNSDASLAFGNKNEKGFLVRITDVFDNPIIVNSDVSHSVLLESSKEITSKKEGPNGYFELVSGSNKREFSYNFVENLLSKGVSNDESGNLRFGIFNLLIRVNDDSLFGDKGLGIETQVKVLTKVDGISFGAALAKDAESEGYQRAKYPNGKIKEIYELSPSNRVKVEIGVKSDQRPTFIGVQFVDSMGNIVLQVVPRRKQDKYSLSIDISKKTYSVLKEGRYSVNLVLSDALYENGGILWKNIMSFDSTEEEEDIYVKEYEPINDETPLWKAKDEIEHTFAQANEEISPALTSIFSLLLWLPLLWLLFSYFVKERIMFSCMDTFPLPFLFFLSLISVAFVLAKYWTQTNIFQAGGYLTIASVPLYFIMYRILKNRLKTRTAKRSKSD